MLFAKWNLSASLQPPPSLRSPGAASLTARPGSAVPPVPPRSWAGGARRGADTSCLDEGPPQQHPEPRHTPHRSHRSPFRASKFMAEVERPVSPTPSCHAMTVASQTALRGDLAGGAPSPILQAQGAKSDLRSGPGKPLPDDTASPHVTEIKGDGSDRNALRRDSRRPLLRTRRRQEVREARSCPGETLPR